jgi:hypothetical protein
MADLKETVFECVDVDDQATFCSGERKWINKILRLKEKFPDEVEIVCDPDDNDGIILAHVPKNWLKVSPPKKVDYSDEQRAAAAERLAEARKKRGV